MIDSLSWFDFTLALMLIGVALRVLFAPDLFQAVVLFIVFGLLLTIAWCRLGAVDVALAEAGIGAGLTGALLLNTLAATHPPRAIDRDWEAPRRDEPERSTCWEQGRTVGILIVLCVATGGGALWMADVVMPLANDSAAPRIAVDDMLPQSGVSHPVTAVLLNFRAHDTLLEVVVVLLAVLAVAPLATVSGVGSNNPPPGPMLATFVRMIVPVVGVVAVYLLWSGSKAPGGAFQAAALLAAGGVLLSISGTELPRGHRRRWRFLLVSGLTVFLLVGLLGVVRGGKFLEYPYSRAGASILLVETSLTVSLALALMMLFDAVSPRGMIAGQVSSNGSSRVEVPGEARP